MTKFSKKAGANQQRIDSIIDAAETVILKKGYDNSTFTDFAEVANYNKRTIYLYFKNKDDIFAAVTYRVLDKIELFIQKKVIAQENGLTNLQNIVWGYYTFFLSNPKYFSLLWTLEERYFVPNKEEEYASHILKSFEKRKSAISIIRETYHKGLNDGSIKKTLNPELLITLLWSQTLGVLQVISKSIEYLASELSIDHQKLFELHVNTATAILTKEIEI
ncbi:MAG: TetR/AcrR family transcriptional regulator [Salinivirgaceae bacterium]|nr:TetR/AcrR family transcriptional regulator [Salinivirgaceae bacterium]MDD4747639.1 TetR/AcrR family transcriptional regulator [Salinivirgaceae bacterium]MDY0280449.1 TetR/AcrR family transcriptional regulator [Salinivirgaceae bacterium]